MSSTPTPEPLPLERLLSRHVIISAAALVLAATLAWGWLLGEASPGALPGAGSMPDMPAMGVEPEPWSAGYLSASFTMWSLMMVAMMLPSAAPMILLHARIEQGTVAERRRHHVLFVLCYLAVWIVFSAVAALLQSTLIGSGWLSSATLAIEDRWLIAGLLLAAAGWQLTSAKARCLEQCQSPIKFVMRYWRPGSRGAVRLGLTHGLYCVGCCWSLMLLLFVGGVMNLAWVAVLAALVFTEKVAPASWRVSWWLAALLSLAAMAVLVT